MPDTTTTIPPTAEIRARLAAHAREARVLRRLLDAARERDRMARLPRRKAVAR